MKDAEKPYVRKKATTTISLTAPSMEFARKQALERGMPVSSYIDLLLQQERQRQEHPQTLTYLAKDPRTGDIVAVPVRPA